MHISSTRTPEALRYQNNAPSSLGGNGAPYNTSLLPPPPSWTLYELQRAKTALKNDDKLQHRPHEATRAARLGDGVFYVALQCKELQDTYERTMNCRRLHAHTMVRPHFSQWPPTGLKASPTTQLALLGRPPVRPLFSLGLERPEPDQPRIDVVHVRSAQLLLEH